MTIFRVNHEKNYTVINNYICTEKKLSWKAKGIWLYAFSRPDDWTFNIKDLINQSTDGEKSVKAGLKELEKAGYLCRSQKHSQNGKFGKVDWEFYEKPIELKIKVPQADFRPAQNRPAVKAPLLNTDPLLNTERTQQPASRKSASKPLAPSAVVVSFLNELDISESLKIKISSLYSPEEIKLAVTRCLNWKGRENDSSGVMTALKQKDSWEDKTPKEDIAKKNISFLESLRNLDGKEIFNTIINVCYKYVEFVCGNKVVIYDVEQKDFISNTEKYLKYLNINRELAF